MSTVFFYQLLLCAVDIAFFLFLFESDNLFSFTILVSVVGLASVLLPTFYYCILSENLTLDLSEIGDVFYNCSWYELSVKQEKWFILPIRRCQKTFDISGLGIVECSLGVFASVIFCCCWKCYLLCTTVLWNNNDGFLCFFDIDCPDCLFLLLDDI